MVVPSMTTMISVYGTASQKGSVMGVFRALGALARAFGPITTSAGRHCALTYLPVFFVLYQDHCIDWSTVKFSTN